VRAEQFHKVIGDWAAPLPHQRMSVYRNNVAAALVNALRVRFPVTEQLVGAEFFTAMALAYAERHRPVSPVLIEYGGSLADFIRGFEPASSVPYLGDVAAFENLWWLAYHAAEEVPLTAQSLATVASDRLGLLRFALHPSTGLLRSSYAVGDIWRAHHGGAPMASLALDTPQSVLVSRPLADVTVSIIPPARLVFLSALQAGGMLAEAVEQALDSDADLDIGQELGWFLATNIATGFSA
jgi:hypothetical protein